MAQITAEQRRRYGPFLTGAIPRSTLAAIDGEELEDRLHQASTLIAKSQRGGAPGEGRRFGEEANRILTARPRAQTEAVVLAKMAQARNMAPVDRGRAADLEQQARDELLAHQPAIRRRTARGPVAKAATAPEPDGDKLTALYDAAGTLRWVGYPRDLIPVTAGDAQVAKAARRPAR